MTRFLAAVLLAVFPTTSVLAAELVSVARIWDKAPHNAFTDLIRHNGEWFSVFREGQAHVSPDGALRVIVSKDGEAWESAALITSKDGDLRDAKITVTPEGKLMLCGAIAYPKGGPHSHQSLAWFSDDGRKWSDAVPIGEPDYWLWRVTWKGKEAFGIGYGCTPANRDAARLYRSTDGKTFEVIAPEVNTGSYPNESSILFTKDGTGLCLLRRDAAPFNGLFGTAKPPYTKWEWKDIGARIGGPHMIALPDGRLMAVVRLYDKPVRTSVCRIDPQTGKLTEELKLPSGGDTSYAGLVRHDGLLWVSYYSQHENKKACIYLAKVKP